jgi:hypothetical protein
LDHLSSLSEVQQLASMLASPKPQVSSILRLSS